MTTFLQTDSKTKYFQADSSIFSWSGICPTNKSNEYIIVGTNTDVFGAVYKGPIDMPDTSKIETVIFPNSLTTSVYGPDYKSNFLCEDIITLVGSYQINENTCNGFGYKGKYGDFDNQNNYFQINPPIPFKYTVVHSTRAGLAVYISSDVNQLDIIVGKSFIYDIDKNITITEVLYPNSKFTTTYGIWYNSRECNIDHYTISGGFCLNNPLTDTRTFVVDFYYNRNNGLMYFENWTELQIPGITLLTHAQGISGLDNNSYVLPIAAYNIDPTNNDNILKAVGGKMKIKRVMNKFIIVNYSTINFPQSLLTIVTSAAGNSVTGTFVSSNNDAYGFQAITDEKNI